MQKLNTHKREAVLFPTEEFLPIKEASQWATQHLGKNVT